MAFHFSSPLLCCFLFLFLTFVPKQASSELVLESGYTVSTVLDGDKLRKQIRPYSVRPRPGRTGDLLLLDSSNSAFYTVSFPISQDSSINRYAGTGVDGFFDGDLTAATFNRPKSFAVDSRGNVYVADKNNHVIRKITESGVTTIAGGYLNTTGHVDGPAQNATFSNDFDLTFLPEICALLISDRGNRLVRQMNLKPGDCSHESSSQGLGVPVVSVIGVLCSLAGLIAGRYVPGCHDLNKMWKHCQTNVGRRVLIAFSDLKSAVASSRLHLLFWGLLKLQMSFLCGFFSVGRVEKQSFNVKPVSLIDMDVPSNLRMAEPQISSDLLKDLMSLGGGLVSLEMSKSTMQEDEKDDVSKKVE